jgi:hypothetical protein
MTRKRLNGAPAREALALFADARMAAALVGARRATRQRARSGTPPGVLASSRWRRPPRHAAPEREAR